MKKTTEVKSEHYWKCPHCGTGYGLMGKLTEVETKQICDVCKKEYKLDI